MLSPPHDGVFDVGGVEQAAARVHEGDYSWRGASEGSLGSMPSSLVKARSRARLRCPWKACNFRGSSTNDTMLVHVLD